MTFGFLLAAILIVILSQFPYEAELPPLLFLILLHLILWIVKGISAIRAKKTEASVPAK